MKLGTTGENRYWPDSSEVHPLTELFTDLKYVPYTGNSPKFYDTEEQMYSISCPFLSGWLYGKPCKEVREWLEKTSIYGEDCEKHGFELNKETDGVYRLIMRFSYIIGGYGVCYTDGEISACDSLKEV